MFTLLRESRSTQDHFRKFFYLPGGKGRHLESFVKIMKFKARRMTLPAIRKSGCRKKLEKLKSHQGFFQNAENG